MDDGDKPMKLKRGPVGYGNPPERTRFKKGKSGNPGGRPKGTLNLTTVLLRTLREKVVVTQKGKRRTVTKLDHAIRQLIDKAASGDLKALQLLATLVRFAEERAVQVDAPNSAFEEVDEKVVLGILKRLETISKEEQNERETDGQ